MRDRERFTTGKPRQTFEGSAVKRIAVVTGANRGIGFEVANQLGRQGFRVILAARRPEAGERLPGVSPQTGWTSSRIDWTLQIQLR